jgi:hypothetical protein
VAREAWWDGGTHTRQKLNDQRSDLGQVEETDDVGGCHVCREPDPNATKTLIDDEISLPSA